MRLLIAAIGKGRGGAEMQLFSEYVKRLPWKVTLKELDARNAAGSRRAAAETALLLKAAAGADRVALLDERGESLASREFAARLAQWQRDGAGTAAFLIGGADGVTEEARRRADLVLSLGRMTWPHLLARAMLAEQLYRAASLLAGHPYHRG